MAITFPATPANGEVYADPGSGQRYTWDGVKWLGNAAGIRKVEQMTQAAYTALPVKDPTVLYLLS
jgi:hypothetical protein